MFSYAKISKAKLFFSLSKDSESAVNHSEKSLFTNKQVDITMRAKQEVELYFHAAQSNALVTLVISGNIFVWKQSSRLTEKAGLFPPTPTGSQFLTTGAGRVQIVIHEPPAI